MCVAGAKAVVLRDLRTKIPWYFYVPASCQFRLLEKQAFHIGQSQVIEHRTSCDTSAHNDGIILRIRWRGT